MTTGSADYQVNDERRYVEFTLGSIIREAQAMADRVAGFLEANGVRRHRPSQRQAEVSVIPPAPIAASLLDLAGALKLADWERAGVKPLVAGDCPSSTNALAIAFSHPHASQDSGARPEVLRKVFQVWMEQFMRSANFELNIDILRPRTVRQDLLQNLVEFLWAHRTLGGGDDLAPND